MSSISPISSKILRDRSPGLAGLSWDTDGAPTERAFQEPGLERGSGLPIQELPVEIIQSRSNFRRTESLALVGVGAVK